MRPSYFLVALVLSLPASATAQDTDQAYRDSIARIESRLFSATNLLCEYGEGTLAAYDGVLGVEAGPTLELDDGLTAAVFTDIDADGQRANLLGLPVVVLRSGTGLNFIETTPTGSLVLTTVFATVFNNSNDYVAVTSRHLGIVTGAPPVVSQYHGRCFPF